MCTLAIIAHNVRRNIIASTERRHVNSCVAWATRLHEEHGKPFEEHYWKLIHEANQKYIEINRVNALIQSIEGVHIETYQP